MRDALIGLAGVVLGWLLTIISSNLGRLHISVQKSNCSYDDTDKRLCSGNSYMTVEFELVVYNSKFYTSGMDMCKVWIQYSDGHKEEIKSIFSDGKDVDEFDKLLNIDAKTNVKAKYRKSCFIINDPKRLKDRCKIYLEYRKTGSKITRKRILIRENELPTINI